MADVLKSRKSGKEDTKLDPLHEPLLELVPGHIPLLPVDPHSGAVALLNGWEVAG